MGEEAEMTIWVIEVEDGGQAEWVPYSEHRVIASIDVVLVYLTPELSGGEAVRLE